MNALRRADRGLIEGPLALYSGLFKTYLSDCGYAPETIRSHLASVAHFDRWLERQRLSVDRIDESLVQQFLGHLPECACFWPAPRTHATPCAALGILLTVLRNAGVIPRPVPAAVSACPVEAELDRFDAYLDRARGLASKTRRGYLRTVRYLLLECFGTADVVIARITPDDVRQFLARQSARYTTPASAATMITAVRV